MTTIALFYVPTFWHFLSGNGYQFWSGVAGSFIMTGGFLAVYKQHNCKAKWWCPLWAHHHVAGTTASVCHWHHTADSHKKLQARHRRKFAHRLGHGQSTHPETGAVQTRSDV